MIVTVQSIPERLDYIKKVVEQIHNPYIHVDVNKTGCFNSFRDMLKIPVKDYRLHLQDDVILPDNFEKIFPYVEHLMRSNSIEVMSLFAPKRKNIIEANNRGERFIKFPNYLWLQATVFSSRFVDLMRDHVTITTERKWDDVFVAEVLKKNKLNAYVFLPSLVQHNIEINSSMGNANSSNRTSQVYEPDWINKFLKIA